MIAPEKKSKIVDGNTTETEEFRKLFGFLAANSAESAGKPVIKELFYSSFYNSLINNTRLIKLL